MISQRVFCFCTFLGSVCFALAVSSQTRQEFTHLQMGTQFRLVFYESDSVKAQRLAKTCWQRLDELNLIMSDYRSDSEIMQVCAQYTTKEWITVSNDLFCVIAASQRASELTNGLFDSTISPFTKLWRRTKRTAVLPTREQLKLAREGVGYQFVELDSVSRSIRFLKPDMRLDLGGIGKGFALDELLKFLKNESVSSALIEAGGSILLGDSPPDENSWKITIGEKEYGLSNCGISTSGDRFQFVEIAGKRYAHILDPRTGLGFHNPHEVTVIAGNATVADWASTAAYLMDDTDRKALGRLTGITIID